MLLKIVKRALVAGLKSFKQKYLWPQNRDLLTTVINNWCELLFKMW